MTICVKKDCFLGISGFMILIIKFPIVSSRFELSGRLLWLGVALEGSFEAYVFASAEERGAL